MADPQSPATGPLSPPSSPARQPPTQTSPPAPQNPQNFVPILPQRPSDSPIPQSGQEPADDDLTNKLFPDDLSANWRRTKCTNCNYVYEGTKTITVCPRCGNTDPDKFEETD